jgi:hypothetical protein
MNDQSIRTSGKWECEEMYHTDTKETRLHIIATDDGGNISDLAELTPCYEFGDPETQRANGRLMAAAPELLEALKATGQQHSPCDCPEMCGMPRWNHVLCVPCMARAAIAKATGSEVGR